MVTFLLLPRKEKQSEENLHILPLPNPLTPLHYTQTQCLILLFLCNSNLSALVQDPYPRILISIPLYCIIVNWWEWSVTNRKKKHAVKDLHLKGNPYTGKTSSPLLHPGSCYLLPCNKVPQTWQLKTIGIISQFLWIRKLGASELVALAQVLSGGCHQAVGQGYSPKSPGAERFSFTLSHQVAGQLQFLVGAWTEVLSSWPRHLVLSIDLEWQLASPGTSVQREREALM